MVVDAVVILRRAAEAGTREDGRRFSLTATRSLCRSANVCTVLMKAQTLRPSFYLPQHHGELLVGCEWCLHITLGRKELQREIVEAHENCTTAQHSPDSAGLIMGLMNFALRALVEPEGVLTRLWPRMGLRGCRKLWQTFLE